jgi:molybdopterin/thiamine biosynthesis adenylyltransferase
MQHITNLTEEEQLSLDYLNYLSRPLLYQAKEALEKGVIHYSEEGNIIFRPEEKDAETLESYEFVIPKDKQYDLLPPTMSGLNRAIVRTKDNSTLRNDFELELKKYEESKSRNDNDIAADYGVYAFYPNTQEMAHLVPEKWHYIALVANTSTLYLDPERKLNWKKVREIFERKVVSVMGASVGHSIFYRVNADLGAKATKIADPKEITVSNLNRVDGSLLEMTWSREVAENIYLSQSFKNKAIFAAERLHRKNPFAEVYAYSDGVKTHNVQAFVDGNRIEPASDFIVEVADDIGKKLFTAEVARKHKKILIRGSDLGSKAQIDIMRYDLDQNLPIAYGIKDDDLYEIKERFEKTSNRAELYKFMDAILGPEYKGENTEFGGIIDEVIPSTYGSVPQKGSTASMAASMVTEAIARISLGYKFPTRYSFDMQKLEVKQWGDLM